MKKDMVEEEKEVVVSKKTKEKENRTLIWFFVVIAVAFAAVLIPYFWSESSKVFEFGGIDWVVEEYDYLEIFHGRFVSLTNPNLNYNVYFRTDPRENDARVVGNVSEFWSYGAISLSPEVDACRGDLARIMLDLGAFLKQGVGISNLTSGSSDEGVANSTGRSFITCEDAQDEIVVMVEIGEERGVFQDEENGNCYVIRAETCEDSAVVEKFIFQAVVDFREAYGGFEEED